MVSRFQDGRKYLSNVQKTSRRDPLTPAGFSWFQNGFRDFLENNSTACFLSKAL